ncbi:MAG: hypothetical protein ABR975_09580 [Vulcanimicrobiaceae bacterium]|jgi:hypothetical protein
MLTITRATRILVAAAAMGGLLAPAVAGAQDVPSYAADAQQGPQDGPQDGTITGTIAAVDGPFDIQVADSNGYGDNVQLHQGTIINPTGLTLAAGMNVTIQGYADGDVFQANEIDTPYQEYAGPLPTPVYYGPGYWYPGFAYGYGPSFSLSFGFGSGWVRGGFNHPSGWAWNGRPWAGNAWASHPYAYRGGAVGGRPEAFSRYNNGGFAGNGYRGETRATATYNNGYRGENTGAYRGTTPGYANRSFGGYQGAARSTYSAPARSFGGYQGAARSTYSAPARSFGGYQGAARSYSAPARSYSAPARSYSAPARSSGGGDRRH